MKIDYDFKMMSDDDLFTSVFNVTKSEVVKAMDCFLIIYGNKKWRKLKQFIREQHGLMAIFDAEPTDELIMFTLIITQIENQRKVK